MTRDEAKAITDNSLNSYEEREKLYANSVLEIEGIIKSRAIQGFGFWDTFLGINDCFPKSLSRQLFENEYLNFIHKDLTSKGFKVYIDQHVTYLITTLTVVWSDDTNPKNEKPSFCDRFLKLFS